jgi:hypothetical protein
MRQAHTVLLSSDLIVRHALYRAFITTGESPLASTIAEEVSLSISDVRASLERLAARHVVVLHPDNPNRAAPIWMAMPFSGVPTAFRVERIVQSVVSDGWWANCAWDALGIVSLLRGANLASAGSHFWIESRCPDCETPLRVAIELAESVVEDKLVTTNAKSPVVHFALPRSDWWVDIGYT